MILVHEARCLKHITCTLGRALIDLGHLREHERRIYWRVVLKNNKPGCSHFLMAKVSDINVQFSASKTAAVKMHLSAK